MPPKASPRRSNAYKERLETILKEREEARKRLKVLKTMKKTEDRRHRRLLKAATKLDAKDLMELAGIKNFTLAELATYCADMGVADTSSSSGTSTPSSAAAADGAAVIAQDAVMACAEATNPPEGDLALADDNGDSD
jgi:hypothetical protein